MAAVGTESWAPPRPLTIVLVNGDTWRLEIFWIDKKRAKAVVQALTPERPAAGTAQEEAS